MTAQITLEAELRTDLGKGASRRLRHANKVPAIVYGANKEAVSVTLSQNKVMRAQLEEAFYASIITLKINGKAEQVLVKDMQRHPFKPMVMHLDFLRVQADTEITTSVPVHFINEEAVIKKGAVLVHHISDIEVSCLPKNLPEFIEVDLSHMEVGDTLHLSDIKLPEGVVSVELSKGEDHDQAIVTANTPKGGADEEDEETEEASED
jgi:large subunit ribosomal protein L25